MFPVSQAINHRSLRDTVSAKISCFHDQYGQELAVRLLRSSRSEVNKFVVPRKLSRANSSEIYIYIYSKTSDNGTPVVEHGKQRWRTVNGIRTIKRTFYQRFWFQRRRSGTAKSLIHKSRRHQSFNPRCTLSRALRGSVRHVFLVIF